MSIIKAGILSSSPEDIKYLPIASDFTNVSSEETQVSFGLMNPSVASCTSQYNKTFLQPRKVLIVSFQWAFAGCFLVLVIKVIAIVSFPMFNL